MTEKNAAQANKPATNNALQRNTETAGRILDMTAPGEPAEDVTVGEAGFTVNGLAHGGPGALGFRDGATLELPHERVARQHGKPAIPHNLGRVELGGMPQTEEPVPGAARPAIDAEAAKLQADAAKAKAEPAK